MLLTAFEHFLSNNTLFTGNAIFYSDNLGVICNSLSGRFPKKKFENIFKKIYSYARPGKLHLNFEWNRRDTFGLDICDHLSKLFKLKLSSKGCIFVQGLLLEKTNKATKFFFPFSSVEIFHLLPFAERNLYKKDHTSCLLIHPATQKREFQRLLKLLKNEDFKGLLLVPARLRKFLRIFPTLSSIQCRRKFWCCSKTSFFNKNKVFFLFFV